MSIAAAAAEKQARSSWITGGKFQILDSDTILHCFSKMVIVAVSNISISAGIATIALYDDLRTLLSVQSVMNHSRGDSRHTQYGSMWKSDSHPKSPKSATRERTVKTEDSQAPGMKVQRLGDREIPKGGIGLIKID
jgi:hypothetical protein